MPTRRHFTFGSLMMALTGPHLAGASPPSASPALTLTATGRLHEGHLLVDLQILNPAPEPVDVVTMRGPNAGADVSAILNTNGGDVDLPRVHERDPRMSRRANIPQWLPVAQGVPTAIGPYRFRWPEEVSDGDVQVTIAVQTRAGAIEHTQRLTVSRAAGS